MSASSYFKITGVFFKAYSNFWHKILATFFFSYSIFSPDLLAKIKRSEFVPSAKGSVLVQLGLALVPYSCWGWLVAQSPLFLVILDPKMSPFRVYLWSPSHHKLVLIGNSSWNRAKLLGFFFLILTEVTYTHHNNKIVVVCLVLRCLQKESCVCNDKHPLRNSCRFGCKLSVSLLISLSRWAIANLNSSSGFLQTQNFLCSTQLLCKRRGLPACLFMHPVIQSASCEKINWTACFQMPLLVLKLFQLSWTFTLWCSRFYLSGQQYVSPSST